MAAYLRRRGLLDGWDMVVAANLSAEVVNFVNQHLRRVSTKLVELRGDEGPSDTPPLGFVLDGAWLRRSQYAGPKLASAR